jgi:hypothetical protein
VLAGRCRSESGAVLTLHAGAITSSFTVYLAFLAGRLLVRLTKRFAPERAASPIKRRPVPDAPAAAPATAGR